jgi:hypothetical protein
MTCLHPQLQITDEKHVIALLPLVPLGNKLLVEESIREFVLGGMIISTRQPLGTW